MSSPRRPVYDRWRDAVGIHIPDGCRVEQVAVAKERGALPSRLRKRAEVLGRSGGNRLYVRFDGEHRKVSIRPHLVRVITTEHIVSKLEELRGCCVLANRGEKACDVTELSRHPRSAPGPVTRASVVKWGRSVLDWRCHAVDQFSEHPEGRLPRGVRSPSHSGHASARAAGRPGVPGLRDRHAAAGSPVAGVAG
jgi:hypothetical protein